MSCIVFEMHSALLLTDFRQRQVLDSLLKTKSSCGNIFYFVIIFEKCVWIHTGLCVNREGRPATQAVELKWDV